MERDAPQGHCGPRLTRSHGALHPRPAVDSARQRPGTPAEKAGRLPEFSATDLAHHLQGRGVHMITCPCPTLLGATQPHLSPVRRRRQLPSQHTAASAGPARLGPPHERVLARPERVGDSGQEANAQGRSTGKAGAGLHPGPGLIQASFPSTLLGSRCPDFTLNSLRRREGPDHSPSPRSASPGCNTAQPAPAHGALPRGVGPAPERGHSPSRSLGHRRGRRGQTAHCS